ncbi:hypothetical protein BRC64_08595 [Halobacteriales archaeon QH_10_67_22]|nr:MAG: hypothetical protein BRC64_08595 [Halobacteriales archaeon QH_10_67_22]
MVAAVVVVATVVGGIPLAAVADDVGAAQTTVAEDPGVAQAAPPENGSMAPGERLAGTVGVERAAVEGEMERRTFGQRVAAARTNDSRAAVVGDQTARMQERLDELRAERRSIVRARENGSISEGQYRARVAQVHAEQRALERVAGETEAVARDLPADRLEANGVNVSALRTLRADAANLTGPEVAAIARNVSGPAAGRGLGPERGPPGADNRTGPPGERGPPDDDDRTGPGGDRGPSDDGDETGPPDDRGGPDDRGNQSGGSTDDSETVDGDGDTGQADGETGGADGNGEAGQSDEGTTDE